MDGDLSQLTGGGADPHDRGEGISERSRIDLGAVAGDDPGLLEAPDTLGGGGRREAESPAELGERETAVDDQLGDDLMVDLVQPH